MAQNKLFLPGFPANSLPSLFFFSPPGPPAATTDPPTVLPTRHYIPSITQQPHHRSQYLSFSPSLLYKTKIFSSATVTPTAAATAEVATILPKSSLPLLPAATGVAAPSSVTPTAPAESFPSPLQGSTLSSSSQDRCTSVGHQPPPQHRRHTSNAPPPPRQVLFSPFFGHRVDSSPACRTNRVLHAGKGGGNNSPRWFLIRLGQIGSGPAMWFPPVGRTDTSPALLAGLVPAHDKTDFVWGRD